MILFCGLLLRKQPIPTNLATIGSTIRICVSAAILGIAIHSIVDFCLRIPAIAVLGAVLAGLGANADRLRELVPVRTDSRFS